MSTNSNTQPKVLVLGGNFADLGLAQEVREFVGDTGDITAIGRCES